MKRQVVICYDIPTTKRRTKIADLLAGYGTRVNDSVFELSLSPTKLAKLKIQLIEILDPKQDSLRLYNICENCLFKSEVLCQESPPFTPAMTTFFDDL